MYIDQEIINILKDYYGIEYVEGMRITPKIRRAIGEIIQSRADRGQSLTMGGEDSFQADQLEEY